MSPHFSLQYLRSGALPTAFCPGCYNGIIINALMKAFRELGVTKLDRYVFVSGIGCSSWIPNPYIRADSVHTLHGRAVAVATGIKLARPDLEVIVIGGDGDLLSIGCNHLIHAARRNMELVVVLVNNLVLGMTRGQASPTTPQGTRTVTTPFGNFEEPMNAVSLLMSTNANYVARWCISNFEQLKESFKEVLSKVTKGLRFIEIVAPCVTYVVRYEGKTPGEKIKELARTCVDKDTYASLSPKERRDLIPVGVFRRENKPGFIDRYREYSTRARG
ncbi:MAG: 2-oxoacid:ferredoxin oxidoreductase subunit beta [Thermoprotei archaeon]|nr:MAG: 2-oxoacid:ferredoxin oxidoreductase subunit beta [Thermoprotei archaeon]